MSQGIFFSLVPSLARRSMKVKVLRTLILCNRSKTSASFSLGVPNTEKRMKARRSAFIEEGGVLLLFRGVWNP